MGDPVPANDLPDNIVPADDLPSASDTLTPEQQTIAAHPELAPPAIPGPYTGKTASAGDVAQAAGSGLASLVPDVLGAPMDALKSDVRSGPIGIAYGAVTGKPLEIPTTIGTSEWFKQKVRDFGGGSLIDASSDAPGATLAHQAGEYGPQLLAGGGELDAAKAAEASVARAGMTTTDAKTAARLEGTPKATANPSPPPKIDPATVQFDDSGVAKGPEATPPPASAPTAAAAPTTAGTPAATTFAAAPADEVAPHVELPDDVQNSRAATLKAVGLSEARESAITGDAKAAAGDFQTSKLENPTGDYFSTALDNEQKALTNFSGKIADDTGGRGGIDQTALMARGSAILKPLDDLGEYFDAKTKAAYATANERAKGLPLDTPALHTYVADDSNFLGTDEGEALLKGVKSRMKSLGMMDKDGNSLPATVEQAERFKQYLGNQWQPRTAGIIKALKDATDFDVVKAAGEDVYQEARGLRALRARTLDDPKGIAKLVDSSGPSGINRVTAVEKIPDTLANLSVDQFGHVIKTLNGVPAEIQPQAAEALRAIKAHFAAGVQEAGVNKAGPWKNRAVTQYLNDNSARIPLVFSPKEMAQFRTLNDAGNILYINRGYPGAAAQEYNLKQRGVLMAAGHAAEGAAIVGAHAGPIGAAVGYGVGAGVKTAATKYIGKVGLADAKAKFRKL